MVNKSTFFYLVLIAFLPAFAISSSHEKYPLNFKSKLFTLYQQDIFNKTNYLVVPGVAGADFSKTTMPMGTIRVLNDNLTLNQDPSSKVVGNAEAMVVASSLKGQDFIFIGRYKLGLKKKYSGTISVVGGVNSVKPASVPVTGGTGDFVFVGGFIKTSLVFTNGVRNIFKIVFHLYWPPYAPNALKDN